jgi:hypothetical protein
MKKRKMGGNEGMRDRRGGGENWNYVLICVVQYLPRYLAWIFYAIFGHKYMGYIQYIFCLEAEHLY